MIPCLDVDFDGVVQVERDVTSFNGNVTVNTLTDVIFDDFVASALMTDDENVDLNGAILFNEQVTVDEMVVESHLNDVDDVKNIVFNGLRKTDSSVQNMKKLTVIGDVIFQVLGFFLIKINTGLTLD